MAKKIENNPYGFKVCYKEQGAKQYIRHFMTYTIGKQ